MSRKTALTVKFNTILIWWKVRIKLYIFGRWEDMCSTQKGNIFRTRSLYIITNNTAAKMKWATWHKGNVILLGFSIWDNFPYRCC